MENYQIKQERKEEKPKEQIKWPRPVSHIAIYFLKGILEQERRYSGSGIDRYVG